MPFHRLSIPNYFGGLPSGYDYINNGAGGTPAFANGPSAGGSNVGTYFVAFGEEATSANANRPAKALAENCDYLDDLLRRDLATPTRAGDVTASAAVSSIVLTGPGIFLGAATTPDTPAGLSLLFQILDENDNEIVDATGTQECRVTAISGGAVGTGFSTGNITLTVSPAIPAGKTYRIYYAVRTNLATLPVDALTNITIRAAQEVPAELLAAGGAAKVGFAGSGPWADNTTNPQGTVEGQLDKIVSDLASTNNGAAKIGSLGITGSVYSLTTTTLHSQLGQVMTAINAVRALRDETEAHAQEAEAHAQERLIKTAAGDTLLGPVQLSGKGRIIPSVMQGPNAATVITVGNTNTAIRITSAVTADRTYNFSADGAVPGDVISVFADDSFNYTVTLTTGTGAGTTELFRIGNGRGADGAWCTLIFMGSWRIYQNARGGTMRTETFLYTGGDQFWTCPQGVTSILLYGYGGGGAGGRGGHSDTKGTYSTAFWHYTPDFGGGPYGNSSLLAAGGGGGGGALPGWVTIPVIPGRLYCIGVGAGGQNDPGLYPGTRLLNINPDGSLASDVANTNPSGLRDGQLTFFWEVLPDNTRVERARFFAGTMGADGAVGDTYLNTNVADPGVEYLPAPGMCWPFWLWAGENARWDIKSIWARVSGAPGSGGFGGIRWAWAGPGLPSLGGGYNGELGGRPGLIDPNNTNAGWYSGGGGGGGGGPGGMGGAGGDGGSPYHTTGSFAQYYSAGTAGHDAAPDSGAGGGGGGGTYNGGYAFSSYGAVFGSGISYSAPQWGGRGGSGKLVIHYMK